MSTALKISDIFLLLTFPAVMSTGQILFRKSALAVAGNSFPMLLVALVRLPSFHVALILYGLSTILWIWLLGRYPLSIAYPFATLAIVLVPVLERIFFNQDLSRSYWFGLALIIAGAFVVVRGGRP